MKTLREVAEAAGVPESTLRLYRDEFEEFLPPAGGEGRRRRYDDGIAERLTRIARWRREGKTASQVRDTLTREIAPTAPAQRARKRNTDERLDELAALLRAQASEVAMLRVEVGALRADVRRLTAVLRADAPPTLEEALSASEK